MNKQNIIIICIVALIFFVGAYLLMKQGKDNQAPEHVSQSDWGAYENTKYGYALQYPKEFFAQQVSKTEGLLSEESFSVKVTAPGAVDTGIVVTVWTPYLSQTADKATLEHNRIVNLDLKSFSETLRQKFIDDKNPNFPNKTMWELQPTDFAGGLAYIATVAGYIDGCGGDLCRYVFLSHNNNKIVLQYSMEGDLSKQIISTFRFTTWESYVNVKYGYTLEHPREAHLQPVYEEERSSVEESSSVEMGVRGGVPSVGIRITVWAPYAYQTSDPAALEYNRITRLDLKSFAGTQIQKFIDEKNPNFPNKKIEALEEITFAENKAYAAIVTGYMDGHGSDTFRYIYLSHNNNKIVIQYSLEGDLSKQIIDTFSVVK